MNTSVYSTNQKKQPENLQSGKGKQIMVHPHHGHARASGERMKKLPMFGFPKQPQYAIRQKMQGTEQCEKYAFCVGKG